MSAKKIRAGTSEPLECPECGAMALRRAVGRCRLRDGTVVSKLKRFRCTKCGANLFDDDAMAQIESIREATAHKT